jgi:ribosomal protein L28
MRMVQVKYHLVCAEIIIMHAVFYKGNMPKGKLNILSFGFNRIGDIDGINNGVHAEHDAINKLKPLERNKRLQNINILVIRFSKNNKLQNSKPCANCIKTMKTLPEKKGYKIKNVYYSNDNGVIIRSNIKSLESEELHYSRFYRRKFRIPSSN